MKIASSIYYIRWNNIQQTVVPPICQISFIANLGTAVAKGVDIQADIAITDNFTAELATGYTDARYTKDSRFALGTEPHARWSPTAMRSPARARPAERARSPSRSDWNTSSRCSTTSRSSASTMNTKAAPSGHRRRRIASTLQFDPANYTLSSTNIASMRAGMNFGDWQVAAFVDNLTDTHTVTDYNWTIDPGTGASRLQRQYTFRPRTIGLTFTYRK